MFRLYDNHNKQYVMSEYSVKDGEIVPGSAKYYNFLTKEAGETYLTVAYTKAQTDMNEEKEGTGLTVEAKQLPPLEWFELREVAE